MTDSRREIYRRHLRLHKFIAVHNSAGNLVCRVCGEKNHFGGMIVR